jgi:uncharacterized protein YjbI with pentapeptide repeats
MKLSRPRLPAQLEDGSLDMLLEGELDNVKCTDMDATKSTVLAMDIDTVVMEKVGFLQAQLLRVTVRDAVMKQCDFSSASLTDGAFNRAEFITCRMTGVDFSKTSLHDVTFRGCKLDMANFRFADLRRVHFIDCTLVETDFLGATLYNVVFESCMLEKTVFDQAKCKQVDLRTSQLIEISGWGSLKGVIIDDGQLISVAPYLANELGLSVRS